MEANVDIVISKIEEDSNSHVKKKNREPPGQCKICFKMFSRVSVLKLHLETHNTDRRYFECDVCSKKITTRNGFISHFLVTHSSKPYTCDVCSRKCGTKKSFEKHKMTHTDLRKFKCLVCLKSFKGKFVLKSHMQKHTRVPVACKLCFRVFETQNWLNFHLKYTDHNKAKALYSCDICGKTIKSKTSLKTHFVTHQTQKNFQCNICFFKFKTDKRLKQHIQRLNHIDTAKIEFKCSMCPEIFSTKNALNGHFKIHFDGKHYTCHICPTKYTRSNKLKPHLMNKHIEPITRFKCELCSETFQYEVTLKTHLLTHIHKTVVQKCKQCAETFSNATDLRVHEISHKPQLKCEFCYRSFMLPIIMDKHLEIHDEILYGNDDKKFGKNDYHCDICSTVISTKTGIWKHLKSHTQSLQCEFCLKCFENFEPKMRSHLNMHITKALKKHKIYRCEICPMEFQGKSILEDHVLKDHKTKLYESEFCSVQFGNRFRWTKHNEEHVNKQRRQCNECLKCVPAQDYTKHEQLHAEGKQPYSKYISTFWTCNLCNACLTTNKDLRNHLVNDHQLEFPIATWKWRCDVCAEEMSLHGLLRHLRKVHGQSFLTATKKWKCIDCSIDCLTYGGVWKHMKKFHADRIYK